MSAEAVLREVSNEPDQFPPAWKEALNSAGAFEMDQAELNTLVTALNTLSDKVLELGTPDGVNALKEQLATHPLFKSVAPAANQVLDGLVPADG